MVRFSQESPLNNFTSRIKRKLRSLKNGGKCDENHNQVGLIPTRGWQSRNATFFGKVLIPEFFRRRRGEQKSPALDSHPSDQAVITWVGHSTFLIQIGGKNILVDPNWAKWLSIVKRVRKPGLKISDLPPIDLVLVTHAHYDHLHKGTLKKIADGQTVIVPKGVGSLVEGKGFGEVRELDYWEESEFEGLRIVLTPAQHWGARWVHDTHRGFGGYLICGPGEQNIFHCGDSAYFDGFGEIGSFCDIDVALMPIGAYTAMSGREVHMNPEEAVRAFEELGADRMVPMHYATFPLGAEPLAEPLSRLKANTKERGLSKRIWILEEGEPQVF